MNSFKPQLGIFLAALVSTGLPASASGELRFALRAEPKTLDPLMASDAPSELIRYLTAGALIHIDRHSGKPVSELAESWKTSDAGRTITFKLRSGLRFSDGTPFSSADVIFTVKRLREMQHSATADSFRIGGSLPTAESLGPQTVAFHFAVPPAGVEVIFDQLAIQSATSPLKHMAVMGAFVVDEQKAGISLRLRRNTNYWKKDSNGHALPYLDAIKIEIQQNQEIELRRFERGELQLTANTLDVDSFLQLKETRLQTVRDAGPSLESQFLWFNQSAKAPLPENKKAWFRSQAFRRAVSASIQRKDIIRLAYKGMADVAGGPVSPADPLWFNSKIKAQDYDPHSATEFLKQDGFRLVDGKLLDKGGQQVEFSLITNAGNKTRARIASLLEQDLAKIGIRLHIVTLDFKSLVERINKTLDYEAVLLSFTNNTGDPNGQMNVWMSSAEQHAWNPAQSKPETTWEAEIDRLMQTQASTVDLRKRKQSFDRVQTIIAEQVPLIYLVHPRVLGAVSPLLRNATPSALWPYLLWNADHLDLETEISRAK